MSGLQNPGAGGVTPGPAAQSPMTLGMVSGGAAPFVGPLDNLPAVTAAFSMRRLLSSYVANKAINVRRASDSANQDIGFTAAGDLDTTTLSTFLTATTGFITTWYDQGGSSFDLAQGTAANQPGITISEATMNNRPTGQYVGGGPRFLTKATPPTVVQPFTASVVAERTATFTTSNHVFDGASAGGTLFFTSTANTVGMNYGGTQTAGATDSVAHCIAAIPASSKIAVDGAITTPGSPGGSGMTGLRVGLSNAGTLPLTGFVGEAILFASSLADVDVGTLQANQKAYWGTP